ncbi:hypothetical protein NIES593_00755 [Hydrococcus rivularis NIES-593]|uniref:Tetratricopeptide repeat protein n=1 Tax=Hydrococcus rivularis NIES-593 TaxID=1921803 RepID=A0A1U7HSX1_9CYAN|nr:hypothetical protein [Hydrococcus rivularis]OKH26624.1 hypothetical protein NIES593_00755 [Hydrococcus rivularis NIES-593]
MPPRSDSLTSALEAIEQGHYTEAVEVLEMYEQLMCNPQSEQYIQVRKGLIEAYHRTGNQKKAFWLCQQLVANKDPEVQTWAQQMLDSMNQTEKAEETKSSEARAEEPTELESPQPYLTPEQSEELLANGTKAFKGGRYVDAIRDLEEFYRGTDSSTKNYFLGQTYLVKAYQASKQIEAAIALAQKMAASDKEIIQIWGKKFLESSSPPPAPETSESSSESLQ